MGVYKEYSQELVYVVGLSCEPVSGVVLNSIFFSFVFLGPHPQHMEVPRLEAELEL